MGAKNRISIRDIKPLSKSNCKIKNVERVENLINELIDGGTGKLQVVSDFDHTITKQKLENGKQVLTSFGILNACKSLPAAYLAESAKLREKYWPLEIDPNISIEEKVHYMIEWWTKSGELLRDFPISQKEIDDVAYEYRDALRDGSQDLFKTLNDVNVPVLVFSAGLGDSVSSVLKHAGVLYDNVKVVSNFLQYNQDGTLNGFKNNVIHTFNKNEKALEGTEYYDLVHNRGNVIVMGDSIGDAGMADGMPLSSNVLKIGFLYHHADDYVSRYMDIFDIVLIDDQTMDVPNALITLITGNTEQ